MKTKTIKIYRFKELKKPIQEKVLSEFREREDFCFLEDDLKNLLEDKIKTKKWKIEDLTLEYNLSYSQGDNFSFNGIVTTNKAKFKVTSREIILTELKINGKWEFIEDSGEDLKEDIINLYSEKFKEDYKKLCLEMKKIGYEIIEDTLKDENIKDLIESNDYYFRENGEMENL